MPMLTRLMRLPGMRRLWSRLPVGSVELRTEYGVWPRPSYAFGVYHAADLARSLGLPAISAIEFGVAGGNGLVALERIAEEIAAYAGVRIAVYGFDTGAGLPPALDYRDLPHVWSQGYFTMDEPGLRKRLNSAELLIGDVGETVHRFLNSPEAPPVGFIAFDLDYYSSTKKALGIFQGSPSTRLPRVLSYFDDVIYPERAYHNEYVGELLAIREFNLEHPSKKLCQIPHLQLLRPMTERWSVQMYVCHDFEHPLYMTNITPEGKRHRQLPLNRSAAL